MERMRNKHTDGFMIEAWKNLINEKNILHCYLIDRKVHKTEILVNRLMSKNKKNSSYNQPNFGYRFLSIH